MYCSDGEYTDVYETHSEDTTDDIFIVNETKDEDDSSSLFIKSEIKTKILNDSDVETPEIKEDTPLVQLKKLNIPHDKSKILLKWRENQIKKICNKRDEMKYNTEPILVKDFLKKEYELLEKKWNTKIEKSKIEKKPNKKRANIKFIFENMRILDQMGVSKTTIKKYSNTQYNFIKTKYSKNFS